MGFIIDWSDQFFPAIQEVSDGGDSKDAVTIALLRHHAESAVSHMRELGRILDENTE